MRGLKNPAMWVMRFVFPLILLLSSPSLRAKESPDGEKIAEIPLFNAVESAIKSAKEQAERLRNNLNDKLSDIRNKIADAQSRVDAIQERAASEVSKLEDRINAVQEDFNSRIDALQKNIDDKRALATQSAEPVQQKLEGLKNLLSLAEEKRQEAISPIQKEIDALAVRIDSIRETARAKTEEFNGIIEKEHSALDAKTVELQSKIDEVNLSAQKKIDGYVADFESAKAHLEGEISDKEKQMEELLSVAAKYSVIVGKEEEVAAVQKEIITLRAEIDGLRGEVDSRWLTLKEAIDETKSAANSMVAGWQSEINLAREVFNQKVLEAQTLIKETQGMADREMALLRNRIDDLKSTLDEASGKKEIEELKSQIDFCQKELDRLVEDAERPIASAQAQIEQLRNNMNKEVNNYKKQIEGIRNTANSQIDKYQKQIDGYVSDVQKIVDSISI